VCEVVVVVEAVVVVVVVVVNPPCLSLESVLALVLTLAGAAILEVHQPQVD
jgi:hypothetical protein